MEISFELAILNDSIRLPGTRSSEILFLKIYDRTGTLGKRFLRFYKKMDHHRDPKPVDK
jgi:hypothetical protein